nr:replication protein A 70 kDa DNA-binding subunit [Tanacetum cinerariifolium]
MTKRHSKEARTTRTAKVIGSVLDAKTPIILSENIRNHQETRTKGLLLEVFGVMAVRKMMKSTSGIFAFIGCYLTSWFSKKQTALAISMTEHRIMSNFLKFSSDQYVLYYLVMYPLTQQQVRKTRKDYSTKRSRHFTSTSSSSAAFDHPSLSHHVDDDNDEIDEGTSRVSTPSPSSYVNSLSDDFPQVFANPPHDEQNMETLFTRQTEILNHQA